MYLFLFVVGAYLTAAVVGYIYISNQINKSTPKSKTKQKGAYTIKSRGR